LFGTRCLQFHSTGCEQWQRSENEIVLTDYSNSVRIALETEYSASIAPDRTTALAEIELHQCSTQTYGFLAGESETVHIRHLPGSL
jgi:hypothetical protein